MLQNRRSLRMSISEAKVKISCPVEDTTCGLQLNYGCCPKKKRQPIGFLQGFASSRWVLCFFCCLGFAYGLVSNGMMKSVLTTVEKRFGLKSAESGLIISMKEVTAIAGAGIAMFVGRKGHKPLWVGWGTVIMGWGTILFAVPHYAAPRYTVNTDVGSQFLCLANTTHVAAQSTEKYLYIFYISSLMIGYGSTAIYTLGLTFIDENVPQKSSSTYHAIFFAISNALGPAIGYLGVGALLKIYTNIGEQVTFDDTHVEWVGAWWPGFLAAGVWMLVFSIPVLMLPRNLPGTEETRENRGTESYGASTDPTTVAEEAEKENNTNRFKKAWDDFFVLLRNPPYLLMCFANSMEAGTIAGLSTFIPKYLEAMYGLSATEGALYTGIVAIGGALIGLLSGGVIVSKAELNVEGIMKFCLSFLVFSVLCSGAFFLTCPELGFAGATVPYHNETSALISATNFSSSCNLHCGCNSDVYNPICGDNDVTYFSPCFAGCTETINKTYLNCSCVSLLNQTHTSAKLGICLAKNCTSPAVFLVLLFLLTVSTFICWTPNIQIVLRIVPFTHRDFAVGTQSIINDVLGSFAAPIIMGRILDLACAVWNTEDGVVSSCRRYFNHQMSLYIFGFVIALKSLAIISYTIGFLIYKQSKTKDKAVDDVGNTEDSAFEN